MARNRNSDDAGDSLELLLDTMCNAFGGIIFITFMVLLIPKTKGQASSVKESPDRQTPSEDRVKELESKRKDLETAVVKLQEERANRAEIRYARLPRLRTVEKGSYFVVLSGGKAYVPKRLMETAYNASDFVVSDNANVTSLLPRADRGEALAAWLKGPQGLPTLLKGLPREQVLIQVAVYEDSVASFGKVRDAILHAGFDYNWVPLKTGEALRLTTGGAGSSEAQ